MYYNMGQYPNFGQPQAPAIAPEGEAVIPGPTPGTIWIPRIGLQKISDWTEGITYDAEQLPVIIATGQIFTFFRNPAIAGVPKGKLFTNMTTFNQLPSGWRMIVSGIHIMCMPGTVHDDAQAIIGRGYADFVTSAQKIEKEGPVWSFPSPFGVTGLVSMDGLAGPREVADINNGVPSPAAIGRMSVPVDLIDELTFEGHIRFDLPTNLTAAVMVYMILSGWINKPVR